MVSLSKAFSLFAIIAPHFTAQNPSPEVRSVEQPDRVTLAQMVEGCYRPRHLQQIQQMQDLDNARREVRNNLASALVLGMCSRHTPGREPRLILG